MKLTSGPKDWSKNSRTFSKPNRRRERERGFTFNKPWEQRVKEAEIQLEKKRGWDGEKERESENRERERERKRREEASSFRVRGVWGKERKRHDLGLLGLACQNDLVLGWAKRSKTV